jgi:Zn-dependent metalloprotease
MSQPVNDGYEVPCVGDWDSVSYTPGPIHCLRRTDTNKTVADQTGEVHDDGEIWSRALWDINRLLGRDRANTVILEAQFSYSPATSFEAAAQTTVATARVLYGRRAAVAVFAAFRGREIL